MAHGARNRANAANEMGDVTMKPHDNTREAIDKPLRKLCNDCGINEATRFIRVGNRRVGRCNTCIANRSNGRAAARARRRDPP